MHVAGRENVPLDGPLVVTPNHKSFWDSFFIAAAIPRHPLRFMGKSELFEGRRGRLLIRMGAFPVRRGHSDEDALDTAREILRQGGVLALFPEGTRVRDPGALGEPKRGAARLALETGAPILPAAITGTEKLFAGPVPKPRRVQVAFGEPIPVRELEASPEAAGRVVEEELWPQVEGEFTRLLSRPGMIAAGLAALGVSGGLAYRARGGKKKQRFTLPGRKRKRRRGPFR